MKFIRGILPHILIILSGIFIVFLILDSYNPTMDFVGNPISLKLFWSFCILSIVNGIITVISNRREWRSKQ
jgi:hypothetical protein